jgi:hypothetical protein
MKPTFVVHGNPPYKSVESEVEYSHIEEFYMKRSKFSDSQIMEALKRVEAGIGFRVKRGDVAQLVRAQDSQLKAAAMSADIVVL